MTDGYFETVARSFEEGLHKAQPSARVKIADWATRTTCFLDVPPGINQTDAGTVVPNFAEASCRKLLDGLQVHYVVLLDGIRTASSWSESGLLEHEVHNNYRFRVDAKLYDAVTTQVRCEAHYDLSALTRDWLSIAPMPLLFMLPVPVFYSQVLDEGSYWRTLGHEAGYTIGSCFMPLSDKK